MQAISAYLYEEYHIQHTEKEEQQELQILAQDAERIIEKASFKTLLQILADHGDRLLFKVTLLTLICCLSSLQSALLPTRTCAVDAVDALLLL